MKSPRRSTNDLPTHFVTLLHDLPFAASITDESHRFIAVNEAFCRLYRLRPHEVLQKTPWLIAPSDFPENLSADIRKSVGLVGTWFGRIRNRRSDGERLNLSLAAVKLPTGNLLPQGKDFRLGIVVLPQEQQALLTYSLTLMAELYGGNSENEQEGAVLTPRQTQIQRLLRSGLKTKEIAVLLGLSASTVRVHRSAAQFRPRKNCGKI